MFRRRRGEFAVSDWTDGRGRVRAFWTARRMARRRRQNDY